MPQSAVPAPTSHEAVLMAYSYMLGLLGIAAICILPVYLWRKRRELACDLRPWPLSWLDFFILIWLLFAWSIAAGAVANWLLPLRENATGDYPIWRSAAGDTVSQLGMAGLFLGYRMFLPFQVRAPLSSRKLPAPKALLYGAGFFFALIPAIWLLGFTWLLFLGWLKGLGLDVSMDQQLLVDYFGNTESPWAFAALLLLAVGVAPAVEELIFRAGIYRFLKSRVSRTTAAVLAAALFAALHFNLLSFPSLLLLALVLTFAYEVTGSLRVPIILHALFNLNTILLIVLNPKVG